MTALRPERASGGGDQSPHGYESAGEFAAAVDGLADPLNDPLPGRGEPAPPAPEPAPEPGREPGPGSPWFRSSSQQPAPRPSQAPRQPQRPAHGGEPLLPQGWQDAGNHSGGQVPGYGQRQPYDARTPSAPSPGPAPVDSYGADAPGWAPGTPPATPSAPAPRQRPATRRRAVDGGETAVMPALDAEAGGPAGDEASTETSGVPAPDETLKLGRVTRREASAASAAAGADAPGGRAARRKAAQQASRRGGRRAKGPVGTGAASAASGAASEAPVAPLSRVEARRAARAAKESPGVIASRIAGEVFITLGVVMLLFVTYQLWWSNILADQEAGGATKSLQHEWDSGDNSDADMNYADGQNFAIIYIPKLDVKAPIAQGVGKTKVLDKGMVGHYDGAPFNTAMPWDKTGNFALAAHRNTHGEPFRYINKLVKGDKVVVETANTYYTYAITSMLPQTSPSNISVIEPVPTGSGFTKAGRYISLTTCTPEFTSTYRLIVWGKMVAQQPRSKGTPAILQGG